MALAASVRSNSLKSATTVLPVDGSTSRRSTPHSTLSTTSSFLRPNRPSAPRDPGTGTLPRLNDESVCDRLTRRLVTLPSRIHSMPRTCAGLASSPPVTMPSRLCSFSSWSSCARSMTSNRCELAHSVVIWSAAIADILASTPSLTMNAGTPMRIGCCPGAGGE